MADTDSVRQLLGKGLAIPACPLALNSSRKFDERRQRALFRYYRAAGAGGIAVGVHTTQFAIHDPKVGLFEPLLSIAAEEWPAPDSARVRIAGLCGSTAQAVAEATLSRRFGFNAGLLSLAAMSRASDDQLIDHCKAVGEVIPLFGFYLQTSVGGRVLPYSFWRRFCEIPAVVAIKIAPFNRYQTVDVVRAVAESGRTEIALYTGNDDNIVADLLTPFRFEVGGSIVERRIVGGLLGHWAVWTKKAVELHAECRRLSEAGASIPQDLLKRSAEIVDANAAFFDAANGYAGCIPGLHEVLRRQGLLEGIWCLDPKETLSPGQRQEIDRVYRSYPHLSDDAFIERHREEWLGA
ncbi:MAG TPA: dihydrodipicolinate synthase family protein [Patescibacteria group bacterium]|nr:dihydrodipicolinate synthase family protein [Patescibacteria group bacterium]